MTTNKNKRTIFTLRLSTCLLDEIKLLAEENKRSAAKQIEYLLEQQIKNK